MDAAATYGYLGARAGAFGMDEAMGEKLINKDGRPYLRRPMSFDEFGRWMWQYSLEGWSAEELEKRSGITQEFLEWRYGPFMQDD